MYKQRKMKKLKRRDLQVDQMFAEAMSDEKGMIKMLGVSKEDYLRALEEK